MSGKPAATRASTRTKPTPAAVNPAATRSTRARTTIVKSATPTPDSEPATTTRQTRKPLVSKDNSVDASSTLPKAKAKAAPARKAGKQAKAATESDREPIMAYLRIRPRIGEEPASAPYLTPLSDTTVNMTDPQDPQNSRLKYRFSAVPPSSIYKFSHVFPPETTQSDFFKKTTLPLVQDVLMGQNGLLFTYGVTNSGKTYTVQGGADQGAAGILPRSLDVIFNSIEGLHGDGRYRPVRLHGIELSDDMDYKAPPMAPEPALADVLGSFDNMNDPDFDVDPTTVTVDRNYEYTIWISYAEVYNEKIYDLLASVRDESSAYAEGATTVPRGGAKSLLLTRQALPLRASPPSDNDDSESNGKYISGLRQFRVHSASQAKALVKLGQLHRRVFGTLANRESSRSHGMVIVKVVRGHRGERDDPTSLQISRLTLVDLAGSERTKHTHTTGDRLKEAGNINKSLMVLGQCLEVMRSNQRKLAMSLSNETAKDSRLDTRDLKKGLAVVPFRHSKLTEALMDYFAGDGRTVMIVNVNPYDTGYDENSHVMKFAALAREVYVTPAPAPVHRVPTVGPGNLHGKKIKQLGPLTLKDPEIAPRPFTRKVTISMGGHDTGRKPVEAVLEVCEEDEPTEENDKFTEEDDDPINPLVDALFDEVEQLRLQLFEAEMRCALVEAETREEVMREMEERMRAMEAVYSRRLMRELEQHAQMTDAKIDMLHQSGLFGSPQKGSRRPAVEEDISEEEDVEMSLVRRSKIDYGDDDGGDRSMSLSPLQRKPTKGSRKSSVAPTPIIEKREFVPDPPMLPSDTEDAELTDDDTASVTQSGTTACEDDEEEDDNDDEEYDDDYTEQDDESDEWEPPASKTPQGKKIVSPISSPSPVSKGRKAATASGSSTKNPRMSKLAQEMDEMHIAAGASSSTFKPPKKAAVNSKPVDEVDRAEGDDDDDELMLPAAPKKKKRIISNKPVLTEEDIDRLAQKAGEVAQGAGTIKRFGR
ncbi:kinesin-domain-containing protein [Agrocybe pediades]|nr:kinesin-domain-containing protein [Agrocybe pediades]